MFAFLRRFLPKIKYEKWKETPSPIQKMIKYGKKFVCFH